jgi:heme oxygenase (biliverdin-IX-beta and delta-forming)
MSVLRQLRESTWPIHQRLDRRLMTTRRFSQSDDYRHHLSALWGIHAAVERGWSAVRWTEALDDIEERRKLPLLEADLRALGAECANLPLCPDLGGDTDLPTALGVLYVIEGSTLGGRHLLTVVQRTLGLGPDRGASYLASYGPRVDAMWSRYGSAVESYCVDEPRRTRATEGAVRAFVAIERWLCGDTTND